MLELIAPCERPLEIPAATQPFVIMVVGVNGAGKTTTIGKLAHHLQAQGHKVMLAAADTFRAAAVEQLKVWGERNGVPVIAQDTGADAAAVAHDALHAASARGMDVLIVDTAGRLHTQSGLMDELKKIRRVIERIRPQAPHEVLLVLDAGIGQNALAQREHFQAAVGVTGLILTKLDGTAKGGVVFAMAAKNPLPIRFIGVGEAIEDLRVFNAAEFVEALLPETESVEAG
jgi:fused signal recognition particle receptor